jgi:hypothetical protein
VFCSFRSRMSDCFCAPRGVAIVYHRYRQPKGPETDCDPLYADHTHVLLGLKPSIAPSDLIGDIKQDRPITSTSRDGSAADFPGRKGMARFLFRTHIWIVWRTIFAIKRRIIAKNRFNRNTRNFWNGITFRMTSVTFSSR